MTTEKKILQGTSLEWRVNTHAFLSEVFDNYPGTGGVLKNPVNIFQSLLALVATRASELNDPVMNAIMCRLSLYGIADPYDKDNYNHDKLTEVLNHPDYLKYKADKRKKNIHAY